MNSAAQGWSHTSALDDRSASIRDDFKSGSQRAVAAFLAVGAVNPPPRQSGMETIQDRRVAPPTAKEGPARQPAALVSSRWRQMLRSAKAAKGAAYLGGKAAAGAAAMELYPAAWDVRVKAKAILASQGAKLEFLTNLCTLDRLLEKHDCFVQGMKDLPRPRCIRRWREQGQGNLIQVEAARSLPITDVFSRYGIDLRRAGRDFVARCPFHEDRRPSLRISPIKGLWHCFPCRAGGDGIALVMRLRGLEFAAAIRELVP